MENNVGFGWSNSLSFREPQQLASWRAWAWCMGHMGKQILAFVVTCSHPRYLMDLPFGAINLVFNRFRIRTSLQVLHMPLRKRDARQWLLTVLRKSEALAALKLGFHVQLPYFVPAALGISRFCAPSFQLSHLRVSRLDRFEIPSRNQCCTWRCMFRLSLKLFHEKRNYK